MDTDACVLTVLTVYFATNTSTAVWRGPAFTGARVRLSRRDTPAIAQRHSEEDTVRGTWIRVIQRPASMAGCASQIHTEEVITVSAETGFVAKNAD